MSLYLTEAQIAEAIRVRWSGNGNIVLTGVRNGTGFERSARTIDVLAISTWPSRGLYAEGFEIKSSASDLKRELAKPEKAEAIAQYCRHWWVATPKGLVTDLSIIPTTWGLIEVDEKLKCSIAKTVATLEPKPMDTLFTCSVLRNFSETHVPASEVQKLAAPLIEAAKIEQRDRAGRRLKELEEGVARFESITGIKLTDERYGDIKWELTGIAEAVAALMRLGAKSAKELQDARLALLAASNAISVAEKVFTETEAERMGV